MATLDELINRMYDMVQDAKGIPLAGEKCILERDQMLDLLDELRSTLPNDLQAAQDIVAKRNDLLASGKREAEAIRRKAEEDARQMVSETEIVVAARKKAKEVQGNAEIQARELRRVPTSTARTPSSAPRRRLPSRSTRSARPVSASRASQSKHEDHGGLFRGGPSFSVSWEKCAGWKKHAANFEQVFGVAKICSKSRIQSGKLLQNITN